MMKNAFVVLVVLAILATTGCSDNPAAPSQPLVPKQPATAPATGIATEELVGTWQAIKAEGRNYDDPDTRRDLVAEGGTVTLTLELNDTYTVSVAMPGETPGVNTGTWYSHAFWGTPQIDFYPSSMPNPEFGMTPSFCATLSGGTLTLTEGAGDLLPFDFGWHDSYGNDRSLLELVLVRK